MKYGVMVEGPSDKTFWDKVLNKFTTDTQFDVRIMKDRGRVIRDSVKMLSDFKDFGYDGAVILVDQDKDECPVAVRELFSNVVQSELCAEPDERFCSLAVAQKGLESWLLASCCAINKVFPDSNYKCPPDSSKLNPLKTAKEVWKSRFGNSSFNKIEFAKLMSAEFDPCDAAQHSKSFARFGSLTTITSDC